MNHTFYWKGALPAIALLIGVGCGGAPVPNDRMASSIAAIRAAEEVGGANLPQAQLHIKLARDQVETAKSLIKDGENERANLVLMRAESDAELALALAKESATRAEAQQAMTQVQTLKQATP